MKFLDKIKILKKNSKESNELESIIENIPNSESIAKDILNMLGNKKTKCVFDKDIKNNYYVYLNDTIYLCDKQNQKKSYERLCVISHECIHSIQPKLLQNLNFIFSNLELLLFCVELVLILFFKIKSNLLFYSYFLSVSLSIVFRLILEVWATLKAPDLSIKYLKSINIKKEEVESVDNAYGFLTKLLIPLFILKLIAFKIIRIIGIYILQFVL